MMKHLNLRLIAVALILAPVIASAEFKGGSGVGVTSVAEFRSQCDLETSSGGLGGLIDKAVEGAKCDETEFTLQGHIVGQIDGDFYEFKDETGAVTVEIDNWRGVDAGPDDLVRLTGEGDYEEIGLILVVKGLQLVK